MGEFAPRNRDRKMPGWVTAWLFGVILMTGWSSVEAGSYAETLEADYCHCDLDNYMVNVRSAVMQGKPLPPMPTSSPSTNSNSTGTSTTRANSTTSTGGSTAGSKNTTSPGTSGTSGTTGTVPGTSSNTTSGTNIPNGSTATVTTTKPGTTATNSTQTTTRTNSTTTGTAGNTQTTNATTTQTSNTTTTHTSSNTTVTTLASNATTTANAAVTTTPTTTTVKTTGRGLNRDNATSTTAAPARRKRRDVAVVEIDHSLIQDVQTLMETPVDYQYSPRVKRAASTGADLAIQKDPLYSFITKQVEYSGIKTASDTGIKYDKDGKVSNCSCAPGSLVQLTICLLNEKYTNDLANLKSERFKNISTNLMYNLNIIMYQGLVSTGHAKLFRRISLKSYEKRQDDGYTDAILDVLLSMRVYQAEYHVKNAIEPSVRGGELGPFLTDAEKCVSTIDTTPPEPEIVHPLWYLKYLCLPIALAVLVVLVLFTCIGKKDAYYVRMW